MDPSVCDLDCEAWLPSETENCIASADSPTWFWKKFREYLPSLACQLWSLSMYVKAFIKKARNFTATAKFIKEENIWMSHTLPCGDTQNLALRPHKKENCFFAKFVCNFFIAITQYLNTYKEKSWFLLCFTLNLSLQYFNVCDNLASNNLKDLSGHIQSLSF